MNSENKETVSAAKPKRVYTWTDKRKEAFERCKKARQESLQKISDMRSQGKEKKLTEAKRIRDLVKNTTKIKAILELLDGEGEREPPRASAKKEEAKRPRSPSPPPPTVEQKKKKVVQPPTPQYESEEEPEQEEAPAPRRPASPKQILFYKPKPKPKIAPTVQPPRQQSRPYEQNSSQPAPPQKSSPSLVFL